MNFLWFYFFDIHFKFLLSESMMFFQGGAMCPWEEPEVPGAGLGGAGLDDCLLQCVHSPTCTAVRFSLAAGCLLGKALPGLTDAPSSDGAITYSSVEPQNTQTQNTETQNAETQVTESSLIETVITEVENFGVAG
jgi:hypothetical protein